jgi:hypothetical protein
MSHKELLDGVITEVGRVAAEQDDLKMLNYLVAIPSISTDGQHDEELRQCAAAV